MPTKSIWSKLSYSFSSSHVWMWELDHKEGWTLKNWCFWAVVVEKTLESPLDCKEIKLVNPKGNQYWLFIRRTDAEAKAWIFWLPKEKSYSLEKILMLEKTEGRRRRGWQRMRWLDGITDSIDMSLSKCWEMVKGKRSLAYCSPWGHKESDRTERPNSNIKSHYPLKSQFSPLWHGSQSLIDFFTWQDYNNNQV